MNVNRIFNRVLTFKFQYDNTLSLYSPFSSLDALVFKFQYDNTLRTAFPLFFWASVNLNSNMIIL